MEDHLSPDRDQEASTRDTAYRADIDGLRAVSILLVVGYHAFPPLFSGGFVGVDVFFVISGFLITGVVLSRIDAGIFAATDFYARRIRRIFPALIVVLLTICLIGWFILLPDEFALLGEGVAAGAGFVSNLFQLRQTGYFAPAAADNPLLHLWSLGIEEQFYIFWPLVLLAIHGRPRRQWWIGAIALASFTIGLAILRGHQEWSFYSPVPRAWELVAGAMLAVRDIDRAKASRCVTTAVPRQRDAAALLGIGLIIFAATWLDNHTLYPGVYALLPVSGAVLLMMSPGSRVNRLLSHRAMVAVGLISYPLYLWHWPLLSCLNVLRNGTPNTLEVLLVVGISFALAHATFHVIEIPIRAMRYAVPALSSALAFAGVVGLGIVAASGFSFRFPPEIREIALLRPDANSGFHNSCFLKVRDDPSGFQDGCVETGTGPLIFLWGDSTAAALYPGLKKMQMTHAVRLAQFTAEGCAPLMDVTDAVIRPACAETNARIFEYVRQSSPDIVLLHALWDSYGTLAKLHDTIARLKDLHVKRIIILGPVPIWKRGLPHTLVNAYRFRHEIPERIIQHPSYASSDDAMTRLSATEAIEYISARQALCNADGCITRTGPSAADVVATDIVHLSDRGSEFLVGQIATALLRP